MSKENLVKYFGSQHEAEALAILDSNPDILKAIKLKNPKVTLILAIFLGMFAVDRLYQAGVKVFLCKLALLLFTLETWWIVDIGYSIKMTQDINYNNLLAAVQ